MKSVKSMKQFFSLTVSAESGKAHAPLLRGALRRARPWLRSPLAQLTIVLIGDARMSELHGQFMNLPTPTDVLTFPLEVDEQCRPLSGEIYICVPEARRQAKQRGTATAHEVLLYALHGMLHLCGFDDKTEAEFRGMHRAEDQILTRLGIGKVFAPKAKRKMSAGAVSRVSRRPSPPKSHRRDADAAASAPRPSF